MIAGAGWGDGIAAASWYAALTDAMVGADWLYGPVGAGVWAPSVTWVLDDGVVGDDNRDRVSPVVGSAVVSMF